MIKISLQKHFQLLLLLKWSIFKNAERYHNIFKFKNRIITKT